MQKFEPSDHLELPVAQPEDLSAARHLTNGGVALIAPVSKEVRPDPVADLDEGETPLNVAPIAEPTDRKHNLLRIILIVVAVIIITLVPLSAILGLLTMGDTVAAAMESCAVIGSMIALVLRREQTSGYILILGGTLALLVRSWLNSGDLTSFFFNYFTLVACIVFAGLIIHEIAPFVIAGVAIAGFSLVLWYYSQLNPDQTAILIKIFAGGSAIHILMAVMSWANARAIRTALSRMREQNERLLQVNRRLERNIALSSNAGENFSQLASDLLQFSHEQSDSAQLQAESVVIVTSTLEELSATARQVADVADSVYSATEQALHTAETGGKAVGFGIDSIATLTDQVETISRIANELGVKSRRISEIVETITELAEETNLLALNATIEAAGAGEYGRRFAVVAQEVQFLATRSRAASRDVQNILGQIRTSINNTLKATNEGLNEAQRMSEVASQAGEALEQIIENVEGTTYLARQINLTTQQQRTATDQAVEMIRQLASSSRDTIDRSQQLLRASDRLSQTAASLRQGHRPGGFPET